MPKTVLISGGGGFLGSHLADRYIADGYNVVCVDNFSTGNKRNLKHLAKHSRFKLVEHDICEPLPKDLAAMKFDIVANLASPASPPHYQRLAVETLNVGSQGTLNMLELARKNKARFFQASTSEVYGDPEVHPQPEDYKGSVNCYGPRSMYDESKRYAEALIYVYKEQFGVNTVIARFFNTYGPRMDPEDGRVVSNFIVQALRGEALTVYGEGDQTRSFCYVDDLVEGIVRLIGSKESRPTNLGNPKEFTILELAQIVQELLPQSTKIVKKPLPSDDPTQRKPVIKRAEQELGWRPNVPLREGLKLTIEYFKSVI